MTEKNKVNTDDLLKTKESFLVVELAYDIKYVFKYAQGMKFLESLNGAESYSDPYTETPTIISLAKGTYLKAYPISQERYLELKMNALLKVDTNPNA